MQNVQVKWSNNEDRSVELVLPFFCWGITLVEGYVLWQKSDCFVEKTKQIKSYRLLWCFCAQDQPEDSGQGL